MLRSSLERQFDKTNFISPKRTPPKSPHHLGLTEGLLLNTKGSSIISSLSMYEQQIEIVVLSLNR